MNTVTKMILIPEDQYKKTEQADLKKPSHRNVKLFNQKMLKGLDKKPKSELRMIIESDLPAEQKAKLIENRFKKTVTQTGVQTQRETPEDSSDEQHSSIFATPKADFSRDPLDELTMKLDAFAPEPQTPESIKSTPRPQKIVPKVLDRRQALEAGIRSIPGLLTVNGEIKKDDGNIFARSSVKTVVDYMIKGDKSRAPSGYAHVLTELKKKRPELIPLLDPNSAEPTWENLQKSSITYRKPM